MEEEDDDCTHCSNKYSEDEAPYHVKNALEQLSCSSFRLKKLSGYISVLTFSHLALGLSFALFSRNVYHHITDLMLICDISIFFLTIGFLSKFDRLITNGDILFQEISDELEWHVSVPNKVEIKSSYSSDRDRPGLFVRIALREFVLATRLPFVRGNQGVFVYVTFNLLVTFFSIAVNYLSPYKY